MSHPTDWDVDFYRTSHESEEHWQLRKKFMERWKNNFPEDRLVCLARVFTNIEFLGSRYSPEVMSLVAELSKEVAQEYRESRKSTIQRTFVSASNAAVDKVKGMNNKPINVNINSDPSAKRREKRNKKKMIVTFQQCQIEPLSALIRSDYENSFQKASKRNDNYERQTNNPTNTTCNGVISSEFGNLVLRDVEGPYTNKLVTSCRFCKVSINVPVKQTKIIWTSHATVNGVALSSVQRLSHKEAKEAACKVAWENLQKRLYTLVDRRRYASKEDYLAKRKNLLMSEPKEKEKEIVCVNVATENKKCIKQNRSIKNIKSDNLIDGLNTKVDSAIGIRMMQMMGWKGGALGSSGNGISEPIQPNFRQIRRAGLGSIISKENTKESVETVSPKSNVANVIDCIKTATNNKSSQNTAVPKISNSGLSSDVSSNKEIGVQDGKTAMNNESPQYITVPTISKPDLSCDVSSSEKMDIHDPKTVMINEPPLDISVPKISKAGLSCDVPSNEEMSIQDALRKTIREFAENDTTDYHLMFASDFTKEERKMMHNYAQSMKLKSKSYGKDDNRYIVMKKVMNVEMLVKKLLENGGSNQKFILIPPFESTL